MSEPLEAPTNENCPNPVLKISGLWAGYQNQPALLGIDLCLSKGDLVGLIGPNGGGKSTLIKAIVGLLSPWHGSIEILGEPPERARRFLGYVPQKSEVDWSFPATTLDIVLMGTYGKLGILRRPGKHERALAQTCLKQVGIGDLAERQIGELSGGQQKRVFLARALVQEPQILLLDEPVSGVDVVSQHSIFEILEGLSERGVTVLVATHELSHIASRFQRIICLNRRIVANGPPEEVLTPGILNETYGAHHLLTIGGNGSTYVVD